MMQDRQPKLMKSQRVCVGCGATAPDGRGRKTLTLTESGQHMLFVSSTVYRKGVLRGTKSVNVCEECVIQTLVMGGRSKVAAKVFAALRERLSEAYNSMRAEDKA